MTNDMTKGAITPLLIRFTIPLVLGNLFQLTYNAADSIIVGKFVGEEALAAVGTSNPLMTLAILFINGMCLGAGILVSTAFGAGDTQLMERQVSTTAIAGTVFSLAFSALCVILATPLLQLMQVPADILPIAVSYLRIVFAGLIFTFFYNFLAATMRALGDSKSALYFLMISSVLNIGGDLFFVQVLNWGSNGCALSTVVSEALCCVLCVLYIRWKVPILQLGRRWLVFDGKLLRKTVSYGWASAMQQATVQLGKIAVQAIVNTMGVNAMAAFTAASRIDDFAYTPQQNIGHAMTTLMAQNRGAGKHDRVKQGFHCGMRIEAAYGVLIAVVCFAGAPFIMKLFLSTVVSEALCCVLCVLYIRWKVPVLQLGRRWLVFDGSLLRKTVSYGWASAMQQATVQLGKIAVQAIVNTMGVNAMAAFTAASRIDDFAYTPQQNIGHAMTTLMAQNRGAGKHDRVKQGFHCGMRIEAAYGVLIAVVCFSGAPFIMKLFVTDPEVVHLGVRFLRTVSLFYLMPAATNGIQGFFRGIGDLKVTLVSSTFNMVFRVAAAAVFVLVWKMEIEALPYSYAVGWVVMLLYELPMLVRYLRSHGDEL